MVVHVDLRQGTHHYLGEGVRHHQGGLQGEGRRRDGENEQGLNHHLSSEKPFELCFLLIRMYFTVEFGVWSCNTNMCAPKHPNVPRRGLGTLYLVRNLKILLFRRLFTSQNTARSTAQQTAQSAAVSPIPPTLTVEFSSDQYATSSTGRSTTEWHVAYTLQCCCCFWRCFETCCGLG